MKYFMGYRHERNTFPSSLCIKLPQMNAYAKYFDRNSKYINHLAKGEKMVKKYLKVLTNVKIELNSELVYSDKHIKTEKKIYDYKVYKNFQHNKIPKDNEYYVCLSVILLDSIFVNSNKEYPQIF